MDYEQVHSSHHRSPNRWFVLSLEPVIVSEDSAGWEAPELPNHLLLYTSVKSVHFTNFPELPQRAEFKLCR